MNQSLLFNENLEPIEGRPASVVPSHNGFTNNNGVPPGSLTRGQSNMRFANGFANHVGPSFAAASGNMNNGVASFAAASGNMMNGVASFSAASGNVMNGVASFSAANGNMINGAMGSNGSGSVYPQQRVLSHHNGAFESGISTQQGAYASGGSYQEGALAVSSFGSSFGSAGAKAKRRWTDRRKRKQQGQGSPGSSPRVASVSSGTNQAMRHGPGPGPDPRAVPLSDSPLGPGPSAATLSGSSLGPGPLTGESGVRITSAMLGLTSSARAILPERVMSQSDERRRVQSSGNMHRIPSEEWEGR